MSIGTSRFSLIYVVIAVIVYFVATPSSIAAGSSSIKGKILDKLTGEPLIGATVVVVNTSLGASANINGEVFIYGVPAGEDTLRISYVGYQTITVQVTIIEGKVTEQEFHLSPQAIEGEEVVVTAQRRGQNEAINQQLASNTISNIVAADRIKELPDANAAESIGRLPGISIDRYNGEATAVAIRGLAPKYNTVTVNGVVLPATNNNDRSVDLSLISSNILDGIEVKKSNTPDMDADALGGTIDLRLKEAPVGYAVNAMAQGGYTQRQNYYGNYNANINVSNRFFDNKLGVIAGFNTDRNNRDADKLTASYVSQSSVLLADSNRVTNFILRRDDSFKNRLGGNLLLDFTIPHGKISANGFYSQGKTEGTNRQDNMDFTHGSHYYFLESDVSTASIYTSGIGVEQDYGWIHYDLGLSATGSRTNDPEDYQWQFSQENNAAPTYPGPSVPLWEAYLKETPHDTNTTLQSYYIYSKYLVESQKTVQFNVKIPFNFSENISGYVKAGGKFRWLNRSYNQDQWGHANLQYGTPWTGHPGQIARLAAIMFPKDFNRASDSANIVNGKAGWMLSRFYTGYQTPSNFLGGLYHMGKSPDVRLLKEVTAVAQVTGGGAWQLQPIGTYGSDYDGIEQYQAGYIMAEIKIGPYITFTPGVRYDADYTKYHGESFREIVQAGESTIPSLIPNENIRNNSFWLPMIHLNVVPLEWLHIHLAGTETVTRPDYNMYAPISTIDQYSSNVQAANASLRDSRSKNLDVSVSVYQRYVGFLNISGFYKKIDDLVLYQGIKGVDDSTYKLINADLNIPTGSNGWLTAYPQVNTWMNNPTPAQYRGVEFSWQTSFWYLPSLLKGLVFDLNWTYITSTVDVNHYSITRTTHPDPTDPRHIKQITVVTYNTTSRNQRMPDQPAHILNTTIGYDYKSFSIRLSYLYQSDKITSIGLIPLEDASTTAYDRWDLVVQQKIGKMIELFANFSNLTDTHDESLQAYRDINPTSLQYYGPTIDVGIRFTL
jgi:TonB-dependent receptor